MSLNNNSRIAIIANRRQRVAHWRLRGLTQREIIAKLTEEGLLNPKDSSPWALGTINSDLKALAKQWREAAAADTSEHKARVLAELGEVVRQAWEDNDLGAVLRSLKQQQELLGLNEPLSFSHNDFTISVLYGDRTNSQPEKPSP